MDVGTDNFRFDLDTKNGLTAATTAFRAPKTTELHLDSLDRYLPGMLSPNTTFTAATAASQNVAKLAGPLYLNTTLSGTNMTIQANRPLVYGYFGRVALTQFTLKYQQQTIRTDYNDVFSIALATTAAGPVFASANVTIPAGYYTTTQLASQLQTQLRAANAALNAATVIAPRDTGNGLGDGFLINTGSAFVFMAVLVSPGLSESVLLQRLRCLRTLGFSRPILGYPDINTAGAPLVTPTYWLSASGTAPNLLPTDYVDIVSTALTNYKDAKDANSSLASPGAVVARIWLTEGAVNASFDPADPLNVGDSPITVTKSWTNPNWSQWSPNQTVNAIDIRLIDMYGDTLVWSSMNQTEWSATLTLTE
jgi:hypothetical protein